MKDFTGRPPEFAGADAEHPNHKDALEASKGSSPTNIPKSVIGYLPLAICYLPLAIAIPCKVSPFYPYLLVERYEPATGQVADGQSDFARGLSPQEPPSRALALVRHGA
jgi:hypothetical protein